MKTHPTFESSMRSIGEETWLQQIWTFWVQARTSFLFLSFFEVIQLGWCTSIAWPLHTILIGNVQRRFKKIVLFADDLERGERR